MELKVVSGKGQHPGNSFAVIGSEMECIAAKPLARGNFRVVLTPERRGEGPYKLRIVEPRLTPNFDDEATRLREDVADMRRKLEDMEQRLRELERAARGPR